MERGDIVEFETYIENCLVNANIKITKNDQFRHTSPITEYKAVLNAMCRELMKSGEDILNNIENLNKTVNIIFSSPAAVDNYRKFVSYNLGRITPFMVEYDKPIDDNSKRIMETARTAYGETDPLFFIASVGLPNDGGNNHNCVVFPIAIG
jgi:hypothetical protein